MSAQRDTEVSAAAHFVATAWLAGMPITDVLQKLRRDFGMTTPVVWIRRFYDGMDKEVLRLGNETLTNQGLHLWINMWKTQRR